MSPFSAPKVLTTMTLSQLFLLSTYSIVMHCCPSKATVQPPQTTEMVLYFQDFLLGPTPPSSRSQFGTVFIADDPITETPDPSSAMVGRAQGMYVISALDASSAQAIFSIVFTNQAYNGSTLEIQGTGKQLERVLEYSVVAGTGKFRFARGYATFETIPMDVSRGYSVIQCNVTVRHD
ncbi:hypothetical protein BT93_L2141 [Corymbia citriodora subsp. variegata]|uniref:Dirigent protein n=1 Tax=Corymbia citriodora subsp. variegata TaxID=360336 RepID=A0A8T0CQW7_CORYI|nr:hypothetical protein BT93_L2141 [Corymbia citriodora subsp. variegata]